MLIFLSLSCQRLQIRFLHSFTQLIQRRGVRDFDDLATFGLRETGLKVTETPEILFARLDFEKDLKEKVDAIQEAQKKANGVTEYPQVEVKPEITFDDFEKVQFRVAKGSYM